MELSSPGERKFQGTKVPGNKELSFPGKEVPPYGTFVPGDESSWGRKFLIPKILLKLDHLSGIIFLSFVLFSF